MRPRRFGSREEAEAFLLEGVRKGSRIDRGVRAGLSPAIHVESQRADGEASPLGSKIGGAFYAPEGFTRPRTPAGDEMDFLGQVNLAEAAAAAPALGEALPAAGVLQLFYRDHYWPEGDFDAGMRVLWYPDASAERHRGAPWEPVHYRLLKPAELRFHPTWSAPDLYTLMRERYYLGSWLDASFGLVESVKEYEHRLDMATAGAHRDAHQLLGHAQGIQWDARWMLAFQLRGEPEAIEPAWRERLDAVIDSLPDANDDIDEHAVLALWERMCAEVPEARAVEAERARWRLLWQIDTDEVAGLYFGDLGRLHVMIREEDLARGDLGAVRIQWQAR